jgi:hypothetical protein
MRLAILLCLLLAACAAPEPAVKPTQEPEPALRPDQAYARALWLHDQNRLDEALVYLRQAAQGGNREGQFELGYWYLTGRVVARNETEAATWIEKAAKQGQGDALAYIWQLYLYGRGVPQSDSRAFEWLQKGAPTQPELAYRLGLFHYEGIATPTDHAQAAQWFTKAADGGVGGASYYLGVMHLDGDGVAQDAVAAFRWFDKGAQEGHAPSMLALGDCYRDGTGVEASPAEARRWYKQAIEADTGEVRAAAKARLAEMQ